jgi:trehalose 6-phosphate synthase
VGIILVSNRVAFPQANTPIQGGVASALLDAVEKSGAIWVGSSGRLSDDPRKQAFAEIRALGTGALATLDLPREHYTGFYEGFANSGLWPVLHSRPDLVRASEQDYASYCAINRTIARGLMRFNTDSLFWIHDYHFLTLGQELRRLGTTQPIGFFLHTPFPQRSIFAALPRHRELVKAMLAYDLLGFQTEEDQENFANYVKRELGLSVDADKSRIISTKTQLATFPIGIDAPAFAERATKAGARPEVARLRASLYGAKLAIGVDRIDYSKGLENRFRAFDQFIETNPRLKGELSLLQIATPSRSAIETYLRLQKDVARLVGEINGKHGEVDWVPIRYVNKGFDQLTLSGLYRTAQIGLVTPLHDGMNLVAKEYVAAQNPLDPGVLILSAFAGAAKQLDAALLVNPHDIEATSRAIGQALIMSADERRERWRSMMTKLEQSSLSSWFSDFVSALAGSSVQQRVLPAAKPERLPFKSGRMELATLESP